MEKLVPPEIKKKIILNAVAQLAVVFEKDLVMENHIWHPVITVIHVISTFL